MNGSLILFGIDAGVKLGRKVYDVLVDANIERPLLLPVGDLRADVSRNMAINYFMNHPELVAKGDDETPRGPYYGLNQTQLLLAYKTLIEIDELLPSSDGSMKDAQSLLANLGRFEQYKKSFRSKPALQRLLGTFVEIGIDYFLAYPESVAKNGDARRIVVAFVDSLDQVDFAEGKLRGIVADVLSASLRVFDGELDSLIDDSGLRAVVAGVTQALMMDIDALVGAEVPQGELAARESFLRQLANSVLRGAAAAIAEDAGILVSGETGKRLIQGTLSHVLNGLDESGAILSTKTLEAVYEGALLAVKDNADRLIENEFLAKLIARTAREILDGDDLFPDDVLGSVLIASLETLRDFAPLLVNPSKPQEQLLADTIGALAGGLRKGIDGGGSLADLLSKNQLVNLTRIVFEQVAANPEHLLGIHGTEGTEAALAKIIGSVARALGDEPSFLLSGEGLLSLLDTAIQVSLENLDQLLDLDSKSIKNQVLFRIIAEVVEVVNDELQDPRGLITRDVFLEIVEGVLPLVSANLEAFIDEVGVVTLTIEKTLLLARDVLKGRTNGANIPTLIEELLRRVLWGELDLEDEVALNLAAVDVLRLAS